MQPFFADNSLMPTHLVSTVILRIAVELHLGEKLRSSFRPKGAIMILRRQGGLVQPNRCPKACATTNARVIRGNQRIREEQPAKPRCTFGGEVARCMHQAVKVKYPETSTPDKEKAWTSHADTFV